MTRNFSINRWRLEVLLFHCLLQALKNQFFLYEVVEPFDAKVRLSWYGDDRPKLIVGDEWTLTIKLKHNNGLRNQGGFDYEK